MCTTFSESAVHLIALRFLNSVKANERAWTGLSRLPQEAIQPRVRVQVRTRLLDIGAARIRHSRPSQQKSSEFGRRVQTSVDMLGFSPCIQLGSCFA